MPVLGLFVLLVVSTAARDCTVSPTGAYAEFDGLVSAVADPNCDVVLLEPGTYSGTKNCGVIVTRSLKILGSGETNTSIDCKNSSRCLVVAGSESSPGLEVKVRDVRFSSGRSPSLESVVADLTDRENHIGTEFLDKWHSLEGHSFNKDSALVQLMGGCILAISSVLHLDRCRVTGGRATLGGGIALVSHWRTTAGLLLSETHVDHNTGLEFGGGLFVYSRNAPDQLPSTFNSTKSVLRANVAGPPEARYMRRPFWLDPSQPDVQSPTLETYGAGGFVVARRIAVLHSLIEDNFLKGLGVGTWDIIYEPWEPPQYSKTRGLGGGLLVKNVGAPPALEQPRAQPSTRSHPHLFVFTEESHDSMLFRNTTFRNNTAESISSGGGGGLAILSARKVILEDCLFFRNRARTQWWGQGGGLHHYYNRLQLFCEVSVVRTSFLENEALGAWSNKGGGAYFKAMFRRITRAHFFFDKVDFIGNIVRHETEIMPAHYDGDAVAGGLHMEQSPPDTITIFNSRFENNVAHQHYKARGAGAYLIARYETPVEIRDTTFQSNIIISKNIKGGGLWYENGVSQLTRVVVNNTQALDPGGGKIFGAGVWVQYAEEMNMTECRFLNNVGRTNNTIRGGGLSTRAGLVRGDRLEFIGNEVTGKDAMGGGMTSAGGVVSISSSIFESNRASEPPYSELPCATLTLSDASDPSDPDSIFTATCGNISIGLYPHFLDKQWRISLPEHFRVRGYSLYLSLHFFDLEEDDEVCSADYLEVYSGTSTNDALLARYCGSEETKVSCEGPCRTGVLANGENAGSDLLVRFITDRPQVAGNEDPEPDRRGVFLSFEAKTDAALVPTQSVLASTEAAATFQDAAGLLAAGGAIAQKDGGVLRINASTFRDNGCEHTLGSGGGAVASLSGSRLEVIATTFQGNSARSLTKSSGGSILAIRSDIHCSNTSIVHSHTLSSGRCFRSSGWQCPVALGGGVSVLGGSANVTNVHFHWNTANCTSARCLSAGGGLAITDPELEGQRLDITTSSAMDCEVSCLGHQCQSVGGGLFLAGPMKSHLDDLRFSRNRAACNPNSTLACGLSGAALALFGGKTKLSNSEFLGNSVRRDDNGGSASGGAIVLTDAGRLRCSMSSFVGNSASQGGAIFVDKGDLVLHGSGLHNNLAAAVGGALCSRGDSNCTIHNSTFVDNKGQLGSVLFSWGPTHEFAESHMIGSSGSFVLAVTDSVNLSSSSWECVRPGTTFSTIEDTDALVQSLSCDFCPPDTYSTVLPSRGHECNDCPFGGICKGGSTHSVGLRSHRYHWGDRDPATGHVVFHQCPIGYCCTDGDCPYNQCEGNRVGVLCGRCKEGYSFQLLSSACRHNDDCNEIGWVWFVIVVLACVVAGVLFYQNIPQAKQRSGDLSVLVTFYQFVPLVRSGPVDINGGGELIGVLTSIFSLSQSSNLAPSGICIVHDLTARGRLGLRFVYPSLVLAALCVFHVLRVSVISKTQFHTKLPAFPRRMLLGCTMLLFAWSFMSLCVSCLEMLSCVDLGRLGSRWKWDAERECLQGWQLGITFVFVVIAMLPLFAAIKFRMLVKSGKSDEATRYLRQSLQREHGDHAWWWMAVALYRRLIVAMLFVFIEHSIWRGIAISTACLVMVLSNIIWRPYLRFHNTGEVTNAAVHNAESVSLTLLSILSILNIPRLALLSKGVDDPFKGQDALAVLEVFLVITPLTAWLIFRLVYYWHGATPSDQQPQAVAPVPQPRAEDDKLVIENLHKEIAKLEQELVKLRALGQPSAKACKICVVQRGAELACAWSQSQIRQGFQGSVQALLVDSSLCPNCKHPYLQHDPVWQHPHDPTLGPPLPQLPPIVARSPPRNRPPRPPGTPPRPKRHVSDSDTDRTSTKSSSGQGLVMQPLPHPVQRLDKMAGTMQPPRVPLLLPSPLPLTQPSPRASVDPLAAIPILPLPDVEQPQPPQAAQLSTTLPEPSPFHRALAEEP